MSAGISPEYASAAARRQPESTSFVTNKMCPYAQKAWIALEYSDIPYTMKEISLYGANGKPDWFLELNPGGTVPVLECYGGAVVLPDSEVILDFLSEEGRIESPNLNKLVLKKNNEETKALVKKWRNIMTKQVNPLGKKAVLGGGSSGKKDLFKLLQQIDKDVKGPYLCGKDVTVADCAAFPFLWRINEEFGLSEDEGCERLSEWLRTCEQIDAFKKTIQTSWWWWW
eukprot:CAMPEP_0195530416 /NCGR_PEP_ID=MMETSP0794_2-20130614/33290_1 /TAXON_ID=515487 /ORGANISM="Stephanopyxis turris, Strain CCMP 815" /LENGTH=226 /DNA_ID=CAMNT_0040661925 /DNA_START=218 /DNA_END=901 /DNA_ORIENTATION=+